MHATLVDQQAKRRGAVAPKMDRPQKLVLDPDNIAPKMVSDCLAPWRSRALAPDAHRIIRAGCANFDLVSSKRKDATDAGLGQDCLLYTSRCV